MAGTEGGGRKPALAPWEGRYTCPRCDEVFRFNRDEDGLEEVRDVHAQVAHVHDDDDKPFWALSIFRRRKGQRYPKDAKALQLLAGAQAKTARQQRLDTKGGR